MSDSRPLIKKVGDSIVKSFRSSKPDFKWTADMFGPEKTDDFSKELFCQTPPKGLIDVFVKFHERASAESENTERIPDTEFLEQLQTEIVEVYQRLHDVVALLMDDNQPTPYSALVSTSIEVFTHMHFAAAQNIDQGVTSAAESFEKLQKEIKTFCGPVCEAIHTVVFQAEMKKKQNESKTRGTFP